MTEPIDPREFGRLEQEVAHLTKQMDAMQATLEQIQKSFESVNATLAEARGGWRIVMLIGGAGATVGGVMAWAIQHVKVLP